MASMRTIVVAILFAAGVMSWAIIERFGDAQPETAPVVVAETAPPRVPIPVADSNNDGVPDWQEMVVSSQNVIEQSSSTTQSRGPLTMTDTVSQEVFSQFIDRAYGGNRLYSNQEFTSLVSNQILAQPPTDVRVTRDDIIIASSESTESLKLYGDRIALIIETNSEDGQNELQILNNALRIQDPSLLSALEPKIIAYDAFYQETLALRVPPSLVEDHINLVNSYAALRNDLAGFQAVFSDPVLTLTRIQEYQRHVVDMATALTFIYGQIIEAGVSITPSDPSFAIINLLQDVQ